MGQTITGKPTMAARAEEIKEQLIKYRRYLHNKPELSFHEFETAKFVTSVLTDIGSYHIQTGVGGGTGVTATITAGTGPTVALRADMDALPIPEQNDLAFRSENEGVMHACGHDAHTAILLGVAKLLADCHKNGELRGTVKLIFQPAEETQDEKGLTGAPYMIKAGVLDQVDAAFALHSCPWHPAGEIQINDGPSMANVDTFTGEIIGTGGHGGYPHLGTDPIWMMSSVLHNLYGVIGRRMSPLDVGTISVGKIEGGTADNILPEKVSLAGTLRSYTPESRNILCTELEKAFKAVEPMGGTYHLAIQHGEPALNNNKDVNEVIKKAAIALYPDIKIHYGPFGMGGEDFGHMTERVPGAMFFLGCAPQDGIERNLHTSNFTVDEDCLPIGAAILAEAARCFLYFQKV